MELSYSTHLDKIVIEENTDNNPLKESSDKKGNSVMKKLFPTGFKYELLNVLKYSWPMIVTMFCNIFIRIQPTIFSGHLGKLVLDSVSMAISLANLVGLSIGVGLIGTCDTLFSQSFGSTNKKQVGVYLQTATYLSSCLCIVAFGVLFNTNNILLVLGQNAFIAKYTEDYIFICMPGLFFLFMYLLLVRYLLVQGIVLPCVLVGVISNVVAAALQYLLIYTADLGLQGSAVALLLGYFVMFSLMVVYIYVSGAYKPTWGGWSRESLLDWGEFMKLGLSSIIMLCAEWWTFEVSFFLMGLLGSVELASNAIMYQTWMIYSSLTIGVGIACTYRIGRYLGARNKQGAITTTRVALCLAVILSLVSSVITLSLRNYLPLIFTSDPDVLDMVRDMVPILALFTFFGSAKNVCAGIVQGIGKQVLGGMVALVAYSVFAMPIGISLMFLTSVKASGFWWGLCIGMMIACLSFLIIVFNTNWDREVEKAQIRAKIIKRDDKPSNTDSAHDKTETIGKKPYTEYGLATTTINKVMHTEAYWRKLVIFRVFIAFVCIAFFAFGIICRFVLFIPPPIPEISNSTVTNASLTLYG